MADLVLRLGGPAHGGSCVGRADNRVVFCTHGLPGELVRAELVAGGSGSRFWRAVATEVVSEPHPQRVPSPCAWSGPGLCGGCSWLQASPAEQIRLKEQVLAETLERIGGLTWPVTVRSLGAERGWRTRVTLHVDQQGRAGFHGARSHDLVPVADCLQADPRLGLPEVLQQDWSGADTVHVSVSDAGRAVIVDGRLRTGPAEHTDTIEGRRFIRASGGFWQSHRDGARVLAVAVRDLVAPVDRVVDLYSGVGLLGLTALDAMPQAEVTLVEGDREAAGFARRNAARRARVIGVDVRRWRPAAADLVVLDPPRAGAGPEVVAAIHAAGPATVVYVSCDPATLARDLRLFADRGYLPDHIAGFDLFPGTAHVETVARLRRG